MKYSLDEKQAQLLVQWYNKNKRQLPWRDTNDPYDVWLSEIMLQQTRIEAVKPKFLLFKKELPTIKALAECDDDKLMRLWEGLGYYSRARNLKKCAKILVEEYEGCLPSSYEDLIKLPGIGPYTAGAISSIAFGKRASAVDGNVMRVLARMFEINDDIRDEKVKKMFEEIVMNTLMMNDDPLFVSSFNQGLMELGEVVCVPSGIAKCECCPWKESCMAHLHDTTSSIPYRSSLKKRKIIEKTLLIIRDGDTFLIHKRSDQGLLAGLYEFIGIDAFLKKDEVIKEAESLGFEPLKIRKLPESKHIFTHLEWHMHAYEVNVSEISDFHSEDYFLLNKKELAHRAIPSAFKTYVDYYALRD